VVCHCDDLDLVSDDSVDQVEGKLEKDKRLRW